VALIERKKTEEEGEGIGGGRGERNGHAMGKKLRVNARSQFWKKNWLPSEKEEKDKGQKEPTKRGENCGKLHNAEKKKSRQ